MPEPDIVVIGGGPVGARAAALLAEAGRQVTLLSLEAYQPYNRVKLTPLLSGDVQFGEIAVPQTAGQTPNLAVHTGLRATEIDRKSRVVRTADGQIWPFSKLVIATGSNAFVPNIPGHDLTGVYTFRTAADASALMARSISARRVVVIGGGLLGLEAARGMQRRQAEVTVIEHEGRIMPRQLDAGGGALLAARIEEIGVTVRTGVAVREIAGDARVEEVRLADGSVLPCDTVIICTGVRANIDLARAAQLPIGRGIVVDSRMRSLDPDIYAIGECAEHDGLVHGLVGPGFEQADVAVADILGQGAQYDGSIPATKLKVIGAEVFSVGEVEQLEVRPGVTSHIWEETGLYRRLFIQNARVVGAIAVGGWEQASRVQNAVQQGTLIYPWMIRRFRRHGVIWPDADDDVTTLPDAATVCNCTGVTCGRLRDAIAAGATTPQALGAATGAGNVCGSCVPLLEELVSAGGPPKPVRLFRGLLGLSLIAGLVALALAALPRIPFPQSFDADSLTVWLWRDNIVKQWTGFILLGLTVAAMIIGLRKRLRFMDRLGSYDWWRMVHLAIGGLAALGLVAHTGLRPGANLNLALFVVFTLTLVMGALAGLATGGDHSLRARRIGTARKPVRRIPTWVHIIAIWPLPLLLAAHVLASYAF
ncbi:FAD-dependent oxidoreductase [Actibacterium ureilyticum]|uniref:FAD-dependent oxidoreductase n=1 Tax=Actibacterium ureilyticum TaxID=1590614 RepID=UPI000BAB0EF1|nr:FAD-dependent oxidoreductase [Actibacterium ureilyticum]